MRPIRKNVRGQNAGLAGLVAQLLHQFVARAVSTCPRIFLIGDDFGANEGLDPGGNGVGAISHGSRYSGRPLGEALGRD
jgi:hypothetical protein